MKTKDLRNRANSLKLIYCKKFQVSHFNFGTHFKSIRGTDGIRLITINSTYNEKTKDLRNKVKYSLYTYVIQS